MSKAHDPSVESSRVPRVTDSFIARGVKNPRLDLLELIAIVSMLVDHVNTIWFTTGYPVLRALGRLAFSLFAFVLAYNFVRHTRHPVRFIGRLIGRVERIRRKRAAPARFRGELPPTSG